jgi:hypothetical protein
MPRHSTVAAYLALFIALGGTSYAAVKLPKNSVGATQIKANAVGSSEVKNGSLAKSDFKASSIPAGPAGAQGPQGLQGLKGDKGDKGDKGENGVLGGATTRFTQHPVDLAAGQSATLSVFCPDGQAAIGGGIRGDANDSEVTTVTGTRPAKAPGPPSSETNPPADGETFRGWRGTVVHNAGDATAGIRPEMWVICVAAPATP